MHTVLAVSYKQIYKNQNCNSRKTATPFFLPKIENFI